MADAISVTINGDAREVMAGNVSELVEFLELPGATVLVEHNGDALRREEWLQRTLQPADRIEILRVAAGG